MKTQHPHARRRRALGAQAALLLLFGVLSATFFRVQVLASSTYKLQAEENRLKRLDVPAPRGTIFDRNGRIIADNVPGYAVTILPASRDLPASYEQRRIPAEELPRLFERFHRVAGARGRTFEGSGIGLALVQELVRLNGGAIAVESVVDQGTTFHVSLPFGTAHLPADRIRRLADSKGLQGLRVFLRDNAPLDAVAKRLEPAPRAGNGDGEVSMILLLGQGTEVEVKLPGRFKVSPQIAGAIKAVPGVVQVEAL